MGQLPSPSLEKPMIRERHSFRLLRFWVFAGVSSGAALALLFFAEYSLIGIPFLALDHALQASALIFIGFSCMLSGLCYFWDFADHIFFSRKHFGVFGFVYLLLHSVFFLLFPTLESGITSWAFSAVWLFASLALLVYIVFMANIHTAGDLGNARWMAMLHLAYPALLLALAHVALESWPAWYAWWLGLSRHENPVPPVTLLGVCVAMFTFFFRGALAFAVSRKKWLMTHN